MLCTLPLLKARISSLGILVVIACSLTFPACGRYKSSDDNTNGNTTSDDDAYDDDTSDDDSGLDDDASDDDDDDDSGDDDTDDDDDTTFEIPCPQGFRVPEGYAAAGGCVTQIAGGNTGQLGLEIEVGPDDTPHVLAAKGREIVIYTPPGASRAAPKDSVVRTTPMGWTEEVVDFMGAQPKMDIDDNGVRHVVWQNLWTGDLLYAHDTNGEWTIETVDDQANGDAPPEKVYEDYSLWNGGAEPGIAVDDLGFIHIVYKNESTMEIMYATNKSGDWHSEEVWEIVYFDEDPWPVQSGICNEIAVNSKGEIYLVTRAIVDFGGLSTRAYLFTNASGEWKKVWATTGLGCSELEIDDNDGVHIGTSGFDSIVYISKSKFSWVTEYVDDDPYYRPSLAVSDDGAAHLIYENEYNMPKSLRHATNESGEWLIDDVFLKTENNPETYAVATDDSGAPHVASSCLKAGSSLQPYYSAFLDSAWNTSPIDEQQTIRKSQSIAVDGSGRVNIAFLLSGVGARLATLEEGIPTIKPIVDDPVIVFGAKALRYDPAGAAHFFYTENTGNGVLKYGTEEDGEWEFETIPAEGYVGRSGVYNFDAEGNVYIVHSSAGSQYVTTNKTGEWQSALVGTGWGTIYSLEVSDTDIISVIYGKMSNLSYVEGKAPDDLSVSELDPGPVSDVSTATDRFGNPNVAYSIYTRHEGYSLYLLRRNGDNWEKLFITEEMYLDGLTIAMDASDQPNIYFSNFFGNHGYQNLRVAKLQDGNNWSVFDLEMGDGSGDALTAMIDADGHHHIAYGVGGGAVYMETTIVPDLGD
ncbi:MAG: hypothetical protein H6683_03380 [Deltaproteobacteria bacterium]|nr:hypothetical protein [Deltaproteobacteria bacterium]